MAFPVRLLLYFFVVFAVYCWKSSQLIIAPSRFKPVRSPSHMGLEYEDVAFMTRDNVEIKGWFIPAASSKGTVILCHGYGMNRGDCLSWVEFLNGGRYNTLLFDFRGHGESGGKYCSLGYYEREDLKGAIGYLRQRGEKRMAAMGFSMGGTVALMVAAEASDLAAVVSDGAYLSFHSVLASFAKKHFKAPKYPFLPPAIWTAGLRLRFNPRHVDLRRYVGAVSPRPILLIHGQKDREVLPRDARAIYGVAKEPKELWVIPRANHSDAYALAREEYERKVLGLFDRVVADTSDGL